MCLGHFLKHHQKKKRHAPCTGIKVGLKLSLNQQTDRKLVISSTRYFTIKVPYQWPKVNRCDWLLDKILTIFSKTADRRKNIYRIQNTAQAEFSSTNRSKLVLGGDILKLSNVPMTNMVPGPTDVSLYKTRKFHINKW